MAILASAAQHRRRRVPAQLDPIALQHELGNALGALYRRATGALAAALGNQFVALVERDDARALALLEQAHRDAEPVFRDAGPIAAAFAPRVGQHNTRELGKQLRAALGADLVLAPLDPGRIRVFAQETERRLRRAFRELREQLERHVAMMLEAIRSDRMDAEFPLEHARAHVAMISGLTKAERESLSQELAAAHRDGRLTRRTLEVVLETRFEMGERRAKLVARDQVAKLNGQINMDRQVALGVTHYRWISRHDKRVRPTHKKRRDKIFRWGDLAATGGEIPGIPPLCRCHAAPVVDNIAAILGGRVRAPGAAQRPAVYRPPRIVR